MFISRMMFSNEFFVMVVVRMILMMLYYSFLGFGVLLPIKTVFVRANKVLPLIVTNSLICMIRSE